MAVTASAANFYSELMPVSGYFDFTASAFLGNLDEFSTGGGLTLGNVGSNRLVQTDQKIEFRFQWEINGIFTHIVNPNFTWEIELYFEQFGPGEFSFVPPAGKTSLLYGSGILSGTQMLYPISTLTTITIQPNTIPPGVFEIVAVIRLMDPVTNTPCFLAAFGEFGKVQFYKEHI